ncbi:hypothetical protein Anapl_19125 [Anas platyrhynchos]|uniref:Uncharacterized protein n=1 Tax=Anas platyrhynchos TaxID=8839 RepID=R0KWB2_ANAPL|nr:hypothetical protein Anapl_19125 [Anas platyrhynchos]
MSHTWKFKDGKMLFRLKKCQNVDDFAQKSREMYAQRHEHGQQKLTPITLAGRAVKQWLQTTAHCKSSFLWYRGCKLCEVITSSCIFTKKPELYGLRDEALLETCQSTSSEEQSTFTPGKDCAAELLLLKNRTKCWQKSVNPEEKERKLDCALQEAGRIIPILRPSQILSDLRSFQDKMPFRLPRKMMITRQHGIEKRNDDRSGSCS